MSEQETSIYVHEVESLAASNGEIYMGHSNGVIVFNVSTLFQDLPHLIDMVVGENKIEQEEGLKRIQESLKQITDETI